MFNAPHTGSIIAIFFHNNDHFLYSSGTDGVIVQYNLFDFNFVKIANKYINYTDSQITSNYFLTQTPVEGALEDNIISCGYESANQCIVSDVNFTSHTTEEISQCDFNYSLIDEKSSSLCNILTKRYDIGAVAVGSEVGTISLYSNDIKK